MQILVDRYITAYNSFDVDSMAALMHPDCIFEHVSGGSTHLATRGIQEFRQAARQAETLFRTRRQEVIRYKFEGTRAEIGIDFEGDLSCDIPGVAQAGEKLTLTGTSIFEFKDGLIYKLTDYS
jgi:ketosteroid isomerase-like protein